MKNWIQSSINDITYSLVPLLIGICAGIIICVDPLIVQYFSLEIKGINILNLTPYLSTILILCISIVLIISGIWLFGNPIENSLLAICWATYLMGFSLGDKVDFTDFFIFVLFIFWFIKVFSSPQKHPVVMSPLIILNLVFLSFGIVSFSSPFHPSPTILIALIIVISNTILSFLIINTICNEKILKKIIYTMAVASSINAIFAIIQWYCATFLGLVFSFADPKLSWIYLGNLKIYRASGFITNAVGFGNYLAVWFSLMIPFIFLKSIKFHQRIWLWVMLFIISIAIFLTFARESWLAVLLSLFILPFLMWPKFSLYFILICLFLIIIGLVTGLLSYLIELVNGVNPETLDARIALNLLGIEAFLKYPLTGIGLGSFPNYPGNMLPYPIHNSILQAFSETGIFGGITWIIILFLPLYRGIWGLLNVHEEPARTIFQGIFLAAITIIVGNQFDAQLLFKNNWFAIATIEAFFLTLKKSTNVGNN